MKTKILFSILAAAFLLAGDAMAQVRIQGEVTDQEGRAVPGARVTLRTTRVPSVEPVYTDKRGRWAALLPVGGLWEIDIEAEGYLTFLGSVNAPESGRIPRLESVLENRAVPRPQPAEVVEEEVSSQVPPEAVEAVHKGEAWVRLAEGKGSADDLLLLGESAASVTSDPPTPEEKKKLYARAVVELEKAHALLPEHVELKRALARAHYASGQIGPAIGLLEDVHAAEPANSGIALLLVNLLAEAGNLERAREVLDALSEQELTDSTAVVNVGILFLNQAASEEAIHYFDRAIAIDPARGEPYYYRAIARLQMKDMDRARADLQKVIELGPEIPEADEARTLLAQMK